MYTHIKTRARKILASMQILAISLTAIVPTLAPQTASAANEPVITYQIANTTELYPGTPEQIDINVDFLVPTADTTLTLKVPSPQLIAETPIFSTNGGASAINSYTADSTSTPGHILYIFDVKDGLVGSFNIATTVRFNADYAYQGQTETINTTITKGGTQESSQDLTLSSYVNSRMVVSYANSLSNKYTNHVPVRYRIQFQTQGKLKGATSWGFYHKNTPNSPTPLYRDVEVRIKLPPNAYFTGSQTYSYDSANHEAVYMTLSTNEYRHQTLAILAFSGMAIGDQIQWPNDHVWPNGQTGAIQIKAKQGGVIQDVFTYDLPWNSAYIEAPTIDLHENSVGSNLKHSLILGSDNQEIVAPVIANRGSMDATNIAMKFDFPAGIKPHHIYVPNQGFAQVDPGDISLTYTTNTSQTRSIQLSHSNHYDASALGLLSGEYMQSATLHIDRLGHGKSILSNGRYIWQGIRIYGKVESTVHHSAPVVVTTTENNNPVSTRNIINTYHDKQYANMVVFHNTDKRIINPGETVKLGGYFHIHKNYYYQNGHYTENPTIFMMVPEGFSLLTGSLQVTGVESHGPLEYIRTQSGMQIYEIETQKKFWKHDVFREAGNANDAIRVSINAQSDIALPQGDYDFSRVFLLGSKHANLKLRGSWQVGMISDVWGLVPSADPYLVKPNYVDYVIPNIHVNAAPFVLQDASQSAEDTAPVGSHTAAQSVHSIYHASSTGSIQASLYNNQSTSVNNFKYLISLPRIGDDYHPTIAGSGSDWEPVLTSPIDVSSISGAVMEYSTDGSTYTTTAGTLSDIKYLRLSIPTIPPNTRYDIHVSLQAPNVPSSNDYQKTAYLPSSYQIGTGPQFSMGVKKLMLVDNIEATGNITSSVTSGWTNTGTVLTLTTSEPIETPTGWTKVDDTTFTQTITSNGTLNVNLVDNSGNTNTISHTVSNVDTNNPNIILNGASSQSIHLGTTYTDPGVNCNDAENSCTISQSGAVDTTTIGTYTLHYTATDEAGNTASITRTVHVIDVTHPIVHIQGDNPMEIAQGSTFSDPGATCTDDVSCSVSTSGSVDTSTVGIYTLTYTALDTSGNSTSATREVHVVDKTNPTLTLNSPEPIMTIQKGQSYNEPGYVCVDNNSGCTVTISGFVDVNQASEYTLTYTATDTAGNITTKTRVVRVEGSNIQPRNDDENASGRSSCGDCGPGGGYDPDKEPDMAKDWMILKKVWDNIQFGTQYSVLGMDQWHNVDLKMIEGIRSFPEQRRESVPQNDSIVKEQIDNNTITKENETKSIPELPSKAEDISAWIKSIESQINSPEYIHYDSEIETTH